MMDPFIDRLLMATCLLSIAGGFVWLATRRDVRPGGAPSIPPRRLAACHWFVLLQGILLLPITISLPAPVAPELCSASKANVPAREATIRAENRVGTSPGGTHSNLNSEGWSLNRSNRGNRPLADPYAMPTPSASFMPLGTTFNNQGVWFKRMLFGVWVTGVVVCLLRFACSYADLLFRINARESDCAESVQQWQRLQRRCGITQLIPLYESDDFGPAICRFPSGYRLIVPSADWAGLSDRGREGILRHELAHYQNHDIARLWWSHLLATLHWFNPIGWRSARQIEISAEWAADDAVRREPSSLSGDFARSLLELSGKTRPTEDARHACPRRLAG